MNKENVAKVDYLLDVDRMINEGLGGGFIYDSYQREQFEFLEKLEVGKQNEIEEGNQL